MRALKYLGALALARAASAIPLDVDSYDSIKAATKIIAKDLADGFWQPYSVHGVPHPPYYWWLHGAILGGMVDYWAMTGDDTYNKNVTVGWLRGVSPSLDLQPDEQTFSEGNDDQGFWSIMSIDATERNFPEEKDQIEMKAGYLAITQTVQNLQAGRWDDKTCGGGIRWQINTQNNGYAYKNTISNGLFFQQSARLAKYTGNSSYAEWAERTYKWMKKADVIRADYYIRDGVWVDPPDCSKFTEHRWTYNYGTLLAGCAAMYNYTNEDPYWKEQIDGLLAATYATFFDEATGAIKEITCQDSNACNADQPSFKAYLCRWMGYTAQVAPYTYNGIMEKLRKNAQLAAATCIGQPGGNACGLKWNIGPEFDGMYGLGEQLAALEVIQNTAPFVAPVGYIIDHNEGKSEANPGGTGTRGGVHNRNSQYLPFRLRDYDIKLADRIGAVIITIILIVVLGVGARFTMLRT